MPCRRTSSRPRKEFAPAKEKKDLLTQQNAKGFTDLELDIRLVTMKEDVLAF